MKELPIDILMFLFLIGLATAYPSEVFNQLYGGLGIIETLFVEWDLPLADKSTDGEPAFVTPIELNKIRNRVYRLSGSYMNEIHYK